MVTFGIFVCPETSDCVIYYQEGDNDVTKHNKLPHLHVGLFDVTCIKRRVT